MSEELPEFEARLKAMLDEARELRAGVSLPDVNAIPADLADAVLEIRAAQDRMETLLVDIVLLRGRAQDALKDTEWALEDAWNKAATNSRTGFSWDDPAPRERYAKYSQKTVAETMASRRAEKLANQIRTVEEVIKTMHRGLDGVRWAIDGRIRALSVDTRLES